MGRYALAAALAAVMYVSPAVAQAPSGRDEVRKLEAELEKLQAQVKETEARLKKAKEENTRRDDRRPAGPGGRGSRFDPERMKEMREQFEKMRKEAAEKGDKRDDRPAPGRSGFGRGGFGSGPFGRDFRRPAQPADSKDIEKRLDRILKEVEELREELRKK